MCAPFPHTPDYSIIVAEISEASSCAGVRVATCRKNDKNLVKPAIMVQQSIHRFVALSSAVCQLTHCITILVDPMRSSKIMWRMTGTCRVQVVHLSMCYYYTVLHLLKNTPAFVKCKGNRIRRWLRKGHAMWAIPMNHCLSDIIPQYL